MKVRRKNLCFVSLGVVIPVFDCLFRARICFQYAKEICSCKAKKAAETDVAPNWLRLVSGTLLARFHQFNTRQTIMINDLLCYLWLVSFYSSSCSGFVYKRLYI